MPPISQEKKDKISEQILAYLFNQSPESKFTSTIAKELARDEEFTKKLLIELQKHKLIIKIKKSSSGAEYVKRERWRLSNLTFETYKKHQNESIYNK